MSNYAKANTTDAWYSRKYPGSKMNLKPENMVLVIHTTETIGLPGYGGGGSAPNYTGRPPLPGAPGNWYAHFPDEMSSRALENRAGGVQTNTQNVIQLELRGTCDPKHRKSWNGQGKYLAGRDYVYWPDANDEQLVWLADIIKDFNKRHGLRIRAPFPFNPYPSSYGANGGDRMTFDEWNKFTGICGHQHVPENSHGDPGALNIKRVIELINGSAPVPDPTTPSTPVEPDPPVVTVAKWGEPNTWVLGAMGPDVKFLGERIEVWSKALGLPTPYKVGPGEPLGPADISALSKIQLVWWPGSSTAKGGDADGYPGAHTFRNLASNPPATKPSSGTTITGLFWNIAGSDKSNGYKATNATRGEPLGQYAKKLGFDVFLACEASQTNLRTGVNKGIGASSWYAHAKAIWHVKGIVRPKYQKAYSDGVFAYLKTTKWGGAFFGKKDGKLFSYLAIHTDYRKPAKQAKQVQTIFKKWMKDCDTLGIPVENRIVTGDFNWDGTAGDNPFNSLEAWGFIDQGPKNKMTFMERKRLDGVIAHKNCSVIVTVESRSNGRYRLSDHNPIRFKHVLV